jgi:hypothetical protein
VSVETDALTSARADLVVCARVPAREEFAALGKRGPVVVLAAPYQLAYLRSIAAPLEPVRRLAVAGRAQDRAGALRQLITARLARGDVDAELALLAPLFERHDPAEVAAALLALRREEESARAETTPGVRAAPTRAEAAPAWVRLHVNVGRKDRTSAKDLVGALIRELRVARADIGRIDVKETFSLLEVAPHASDAVIKGLSRVTIRGRRVSAKLERHR